jgi:SAM-dependent methyltransferase
MAELDAFYAKDYKYDAHLLIANEKRWRARHILGVAMPTGAKRVLDIGCMYGYLLEEARTMGAHTAMGVELSAGPARAAREKGLDVFCGTIESFAESNPQPFDLIVAQHVLEHVTDPMSFLHCARRLLAPDGVLCVCVPNFDARARRVFREAWGWYQVPVHLHHFGERGLATVLEQSGFERVEASRRGGDSLFVLLTVLQGLGRMPKSENTAAPSAIGRAMVQTASAVLRPYYFVGDDELLVTARAKTGARG